MSKDKKECQACEFYTRNLPPGKSAKPLGSLYPLYTARATGKAGEKLIIRAEPGEQCSCTVDEPKPAVK